MATVSERSRLIFKKTDRDLLKLSQGYQPEIVHNFRTSSRRLQVLLEELAPVRSRNQKKLLKALSRIRKQAGRIRDLDVQLVALRSLKTPLEPRRKTQLTQGLIELRHTREKKLGKLLKKQDIVEISKRLRRASKTFDFERLGDPLATAQKMLRSAATASAPELDENRLHRYRLAVKRARYAAEFALASPEGTQFLAQMKKLQDTLGHWHDWFTLTQIASQQLGDIGQSPLVAVLHNVTRGKFRHAVAEISANNAVGNTRQPLAMVMRKLESKGPISAQSTITAA